MILTAGNGITVRDGRAALLEGGGRAVMSLIRLRRLHVERRRPGSPRTPTAHDCLLMRGLPPTLAWAFAATAAADLGG
jgi:hypothetical protein